MWPCPAACPAQRRAVPSASLRCADPPTYGRMYGMRRTTVYLPDELKAAIERAAESQGKSEAEVIRSALVAATADQAPPRPRLPLFDSGDPTLAERVDEALAEGFGE
jgi:hypothetical protein